MSIIVAVSDGTRVCMGSDSQLSSNGSKLEGGSKLWRIGPFLLGGEGSLASGDFGRHRFKCSGDYAAIYNLDMAAFAHDFGDKLHAFLASRSQLRDINGAKELPGQVMIARGAEFLVMDTGGSLARFALPWMAIGSGAAEARGAMHHASPEYLDAKRIAMAGVEAACFLDDGCSGAQHYEWTLP